MPCAVQLASYVGGLRRVLASTAGDRYRVIVSAGGGSGGGGAMAR